MGMQIQFPSPALWHRILSGPPVSRDQGTRNPIGGFNEMVHAQLTRQSAIAALQPPPARNQMIQRAPEKEARDKDRNPRGQQPRRDDHRGGRQGTPPEPERQPLVRAVWA
ncbi:MAG: hypothetical protein K1X51_11090 [Rhodospirillaceae bacterium]|nr:hypothetical protein [Rhodospirillaceae bacterium]